MTSLVNSLPDLGSKGIGAFRVFYDGSGEGNVCLAAHVATAQAKGWKTQLTRDQDGDAWYDYTGADNTGVETTVTQQVKLYPNPATDYVIVEGVAPASEVTLHSMTGERLYAGRADDRGTLQIDLTPYADGVYLVCVAGETYRVVVRR